MLISTSISVQPPPGPVTLSLSTPANRHATPNPPVFNDAMLIRQKVFIDEQGCSPETEIDEDDPRSWQWVLYTETSTGTGTERSPVGVIRLVPPPHEPHEALLASCNCDSNAEESHKNHAKYDLYHEPYIKITRVAILREYRGKGLVRPLLGAALDWARQNAKEIDAAHARVVKTYAGQDKERALTASKWKGLVLVHAQVNVEKMYERLGFETDTSMGRWMEEGIEHVGMWRRVDVEIRT
ncbi:hypothetical protein MPDQ_007775 [Monascus purpureus]|uniref:Glucosamine 6-phosphate N-acetyltransferase n=1 Tax=Monascus purpureus TaxID=5098 RepID=A0A507QTK2_MONPU|nr:hypothetical protein MPDQ_007775 [Monascus purpureus]BDD57570.1 hypothetical protein MAP00_002923 [Monascus purpureus]